MASRTNHSVDRALSLLRLLAHAHRPVRFADIQAQSGIPKGTLHSLLASLEAAEFARRSAQGYEIGLAAFEVGTAVRVPASLRAAVAPLLDEQSSLGEACHFGMLDGGDVVYLDRRDYSHDALHYTLPVGSRKPAYSTALGKAMLALQPDAEIEALYPGRLAVLTPRTLTSRAELLAVLAGIRERGYATESEESTPGVCCIGVAGRLRDVSYGLSITVPVVRMREPELAAKFLPVLAAVLRRLTAALTTAEWFEPGAITAVQEGLAREGPRLRDRHLRPGHPRLHGPDRQAPPGACAIRARGLDAQVMVSEPNPGRRALLSRLGFSAVIDPGPDSAALTEAANGQVTLVLDAASKIVFVPGQD